MFRDRLVAGAGLAAMRARNRRLGEGAAYKCRAARWAASGLALVSAISASAFAATTVSIRLEGEIPPQCAIRSGHAGSLLTLDAGDITHAGSRDHSFLLNCNTPFAYRLEAQHGALRNEEISAPTGGFAASLPYDVVMHIPTDGTAIDDRCPGESLRAGAVRCAFADSGAGIASDVEARLTFAWGAPSARLLPGSYTDRLTLIIEVKH